jgi:hypothetical protein
MDLYSRVAKTHVCDSGVMVLSSSTLSKTLVEEHLIFSYNPKHCTLPSGHIYNDGSSGSSTPMMMHHAKLADMSTARKCVTTSFCESFLKLGGPSLVLPLLRPRCVHLPSSFTQKQKGGGVGVGVGRSHLILLPASPLALLLGPQPFEQCLRWLNDICRISHLNRVAFHRMAGPRLLWSMLVKVFVFAFAFAFFLV